MNVDKDGKVKIVIDTALAKAIHGDRDHKYSITAEVTDKSRRTIVGTGKLRLLKITYPKGKPVETHPSSSGT